MSWSCLIFGAFAYYAALTIDSVPLLVLGRILFGWGGGKVITRAYFATQVTPKEKHMWSGILVASIAFSITGGPGISSFLEFIEPSDIWVFRTEKYNLFAGIFSFVALFFAIVFFIFFKDKDTDNTGIVVPFPDVNINAKENMLEEPKEPRKILKDYSFDYSTVDCMENPQNQEIGHIDKNFDGIKLLYKTSSIKEYFPVYFVTLFFTFNKAIQDAIITEVSYTMKEFYNWTSQDIGFLLLAYTPISRPLF